MERRCRIACSRLVGRKEVSRLRHGGTEKHRAVPLVRPGGLSENQIQEGLGEVGTLRKHIEKRIGSGKEAFRRIFSAETTGGNVTQSDASSRKNTGARVCPSKGVQDHVASGGCEDYQAGLSAGGSVQLNDDEARPLGCTEADLEEVQRTMTRA